MLAGLGNCGGHQEGLFRLGWSSGREPASSDQLTDDQRHFPKQRVSTEWNPEDGGRWWERTEIHLKAKTPSYVLCIAPALSPVPAAWEARKRSPSELN